MGGKDSSTALRRNALPDEPSCDEGRGEGVIRRHTGPNELIPLLARISGWPLWHAPYAAHLADALPGVHLAEQWRDTFGKMPARRGLSKQ